MASPSWMRGMWRVARSRWWLLVLPGLLLLDFGSIPNSPWQHSRVKRSIVGEPARVRSTAHGRLLMGRPQPTQGALEWVWPWEPGYVDREGTRWDEVSVFVDLPRWTGAYHITSVTRAVKVFGPGLTPAEVSQLHTAITDEIESDPELAGNEYLRPVLSALKHGGSVTEEVPVGHRRNLTAAALLVGWVGLLSLHGLLLVLGRVEPRGSPVASVV